MFDIDGEDYIFLSLVLLSKKENQALVKHKEISQYFIITEIFVSCNVGFSFRTLYPVNVRLISYYFKGEPYVEKFMGFDIKAYTTDEEKPYIPEAGQIYRNLNNYERFFFLFYSTMWWRMNIVIKDFYYRKVDFNKKTPEEREEIKKRYIEKTSF